MWLFIVLTVLVIVTAFIRLPTLVRLFGFNKAIFITSLRLTAVAIAFLLTLQITFPISRTVTQPARIAILVDSSQSANTPERKKLLTDLKKLLNFKTQSITVWRFSDDLTSTSLTEAIKTGDGMSSRLSDAVLKIVEAIRPDKLIVITDGQDTDPKPDEIAVSKLKRSQTNLTIVQIPSYFPPNLQISISPSELDLFAGEEASVMVQAACRNLKRSTSIPIRVWKGKQLVQQTKLNVSPKTIAMKPVRLRPEKSGLHLYRVEVQLIPNEKWSKDNSAEVSIWQAPTKLRVLIVCGHPNFEFKFIKRAMEAEPNFEWVALPDLPDKTRYQLGAPTLLPVSLQRLSSFHVVVIVAPTPFDFSASEVKALLQFVKEGGGLIVTLNAETIQTHGWSLFITDPIQIVPLPSHAPLTANEDDILGNRLTNLQSADLAWSTIIRSAKGVRKEMVAVESKGKPVVIWWQEGFGKMALVGMDGTWKWAMESARKGKTPTAHHNFWQTLTRFLANPRKEVAKVQKGKLENERQQTKLLMPQTEPKEWTILPQPERMNNWAKMTGGKILSPKEATKWIKEMNWTKTITVTDQQPISTVIYPYLILLIALMVEWWIIRRKGLL